MRSVTGTAKRADGALDGEAFLDELEATRREVLGGRPLRERRRGQTKEQIAEAKRRKHAGGSLSSASRAAARARRSSPRLALAGAALDKEAQH